MSFDKAVTAIYIVLSSSFNDGYTFFVGLRLLIFLLHSFNSCSKIAYEIKVIVLYFGHIINEMILKEVFM